MRVEHFVLHCWLTAVKTTEPQAWKKTNPAKKKLKILVRFPFWFNGVGLLSCVLPPHVNFQDKTVQSSRTENVNSEQTTVKCKKKSRNVKYIVAEIINEEGVRVNKAISVSGEI